MIEKRVFFITNRPYQGFVGGASGVNYRLFFYEKEFNIFGNKIEKFTYIFSDKIIENSELSNEIQFSNNNTNINKSFKQIIKNTVLAFIKNNNYLYSNYLLHSYKKNIAQSKKYFKEISNKYNFTKNDIFIMQDTESANSLINIIPSDNIIIYHSQGSLVNEFESIYNINLHKNFKNYLNSIQKNVFEYYHYLGFPSKGSYEIIKKQLPSINFDNKKIEILYNTFNTAQFTDNDKNNFIDNFKYKDQLKGTNFKFISVSTITHLKGLDNTIKVLGKLKRQGLEFTWFMIGNGDENYIKTVIEPLLTDSNILDNTIQIRRLPNTDVNILLSLTDFYIMMHRFSIFDIATLEAMNNSNIPILSNVGGNKEYNISNNAFLYENNIEDLYNYIVTLDIPEMKKENKKIAQSVFDSKSFLNRYLEFIEKSN